MKISPALQTAFESLSPVVVGERTYLPKQKIIILVAHHLFQNTVTTQEQMTQVTETAVQLAITNSYSPSDIPLNFPAVPFDQEGPYWLKLPQINTAMLRDIFQAAEPLKDGRKPVLYVYRQRILGQVASAVYGRALEQLTDHEANSLTEQVEQLITTKSHWVVAGERYEKPLQPDFDAARTALTAFLQRQQHPVYADDIWREVTRAAYGRTYTPNKDNRHYFSDLQQLIDDCLTVANYETQIRRHRYHPRPLTLPKNAAQLVTTAVAQLALLQTDDGPALLRDAVDAAILAALKLDGETLTRYHREQLLEGDLRRQALQQAGYETSATWLHKNEFQPQRTEGAYLFLRELRLRHDLTATIALDSQHGLRVHTPICVLDKAEQTIVCLQMLGPPQAVKANWAGLVGSQRRFVYIDSTTLRLQGMKEHLSLKALLPIGWQDWVLLHKQADLNHMSPDQPFYLLDDGRDPVPTSFFPMLDKALSVPLLAEWAAYLWQQGRQQKLIQLLSKHSIGYAGWKIYPNAAKWGKIVSTGIQSNAIALFVNDKSIVADNLVVTDGLVVVDKLVANDKPNPQPKETTPMPDPLPPSRFPLGQIVATAGAIDLAEAGVDLTHYLTRHAQCDWGSTLDAHDTAANDRALQEGTRLFSAYETEHGKLWLITEADRSVTTFLRPFEY